MRAFFDDNSRGPAVSDHAEPCEGVRVAEPVVAQCRQRAVERIHTGIAAADSDQEGHEREEEDYRRSVRHSSMIQNKNAPSRGHW